MSFLGISKVYATPQTETYVIALDPGHGGKEDGAYYYGIKEKDANLTMAKLLKQKLEEFEGVSVVLTRSEDEVVSLSERANRAKEAEADIFISMHFNASNSHKSNGASVYVTTANTYRDDMVTLADYLLGEFEAIGLRNAGTFARVTQMNGMRHDGSFDDYYGVLRHGVNNGMPSLLIEHCYMDADEDKHFLHEKGGFDQLATADANGIAAYFGLKKKTGEKVVSKQAKVFLGTTKAQELDYFEAPSIKGIKLLDYSGKTPDLATYEVEIEDEIGISSLYMVYKNSAGNTATVSAALDKSYTTGTYQIKAYIPEGMDLETYQLCFLGAYNLSGYDAGYNYSGGNMIGFGKCDWLNTFSYSGEANLAVTQKGSISTAHAKLIDYEIEKGLRDKRNLYPMSFYPN